MIQLPSFSRVERQWTRWRAFPYDSKITYPDCDPFPAGANDESAKMVNSERVDGCSFCGKVYRRPKVFVVLRYWRRCPKLILRWSRLCHKDWAAKLIAHAMSGLVSVDSQRRAPKIFWALLTPLNMLRIGHVCWWFCICVKMLWLFYCSSLPLRGSILVLLQDSLSVGSLMK